MGEGPTGHLVHGAVPREVGVWARVGPKPTPGQRRALQGIARGMKGAGCKQAAADSPMTKTGMKAPQGTGMVVASADIQNCRQEGFKTALREAYPAHLAGAAFSASPESPEVKGKERTLESEGWGHILSHNQLLWQLLLRILTRHLSNRDKGTFLTIF